MHHRARCFAVLFSGKQQTNQESRAAAIYGDLFPAQNSKENSTFNGNEERAWVKIMVY